MSDKDFLNTEIYKAVERSAVPALNRPYSGDHIMDGEHQDYRNTNPAIGTGNGSPSEPAKIEQL